MGRLRSCGDQESLTVVADLHTRFPFEHGGLTIQRQVIAVLRHHRRDDHAIARQAFFGGRTVNQKPFAKASPENVGGGGARWRSRAETGQGAAGVREALFRVYWPFPRTSTALPLTESRKNSVVRFTWLRKYGKFESALRRRRAARWYQVVSDGKILSEILFA